MSLLLEEEKRVERKPANATVKPQPPVRDIYQDELDNEPGFARQNRTALIVIGLILIGAGFGAVKIFTGDSHPTVRPAQEITMVRIAPPPPALPPPPPPPPQQAPPPEDKMIDQAPVDDAPKPDEAPEPPAPALGTGIKGSGAPDGFGLSGSRGNGIIGGRGTGGSTAGKWDGYARQIQNRVAEALRSNRKTRSAEFTLQVRIWPDSTGRIARAQLIGTSGDRDVDNAIQRDALTGLQLPEPPPAGMPSSTLIRLTAKKQR